MVNGTKKILMEKDKYIYHTNDLRCKITTWAGNIYFELEKRYLYFFWNYCQKSKSIPITKEATAFTMKSAAAELFKEYVQENAVREKVKSDIRLL